MSMLLSGATGRLQPLTQSAALDRDDAFQSLTRSHPFSSIRLNPVPTSKGVSLTQPHDDPFGRSVAR